MKLAKIKHYTSGDVFQNKTTCVMNRDGLRNMHEDLCTQVFFSHWINVILIQNVRTGELINNLKNILHITITINNLRVLFDINKG